MTANNPGAYTFLGTVTYLVGRGDVAVIDPGPDDAAHVDALMGALDPGERFTHILVTHTHSDHSPAARALKARTDAPTYGFGPQERIEDPDPTQVVFGDPEADPDPTKPAPQRGGDRDFRPDVALRDGDVVEGDGWTLEVVHTPGHASNHHCYGLREEGTLFTGDHIMGWSTSVISPPDGRLGEYLASLEKLLGRPGDGRYLPAHGPEIGDPHTRVRDFIEHRQERSTQILDLLAGGPTTIAEIVPRLYADVRKQLWPAAAGSVYAHLLHLQQLAMVGPEDGPSLQRAGRVRRTG